MKLIKCYSKAWVRGHCKRFVDEDGDVSWRAPYMRLVDSKHMGLYEPQMVNELCGKLLVVDSGYYTGVWYVPRWLIKWEKEI